MYTEAETEKFYDAEDGLYRSFWDSEGSLHWGYFDNLTSTSKDEFLPACKRWNEYMLSRSNITNESKVLDIGCGNGNTAVWLAQQTGCEVVGIDISQVRVDNAKDKAKDYPDLSISFQKASATDLPFVDGEFTHVWSQATIYHIHDRTLALREIQRVLKEGGIFLFDDLTTPIENISETGHKYVYERLLFEPTFSQDSYTETLTQLGLMVLEAKDLSSHLHKSYELLSLLALPDYPDLNSAYIKMCEAIDKQELGWSFFLSEKVSNRLSWIYETKDKENLEKKYDAWSHLYDSELDKPYRISPVKSAHALSQVLPDKQASILDAGAGTGMVGEVLAELGYSNITATDLSSEMLEVARKKSVYKALYQGNLEDTLDFCETNSFDAIISVGVFTFGHVQPEALENLFLLLKSGGYFVLTVRQDYYESNEILPQIIEKLDWSLCDRTEFNIFESEAMYAKLHRVKVTEANLEYVGSITIDSELLEKVGILPLEEVEIVNLNNGNRWSTYVLPGEAGSGQICPNGGGALLCEKDDVLVIWANEERDRSDVLIEGHQAKVLLVDENNHLKQVFAQTFFPQKDSVDFHCEYSMGKTAGHSDYKMMTKV